MQTGLEYLPVTSAYPASGLNVLEPSSQANPNSSPDLNNIILLKGVPQKRLGLWQLGGDLDNNVLALWEFETLAGVKKLLAFTKTKQYKLDTSSDPATWVDITGGTTWTGADTDFIDITEANGVDSGTLKKWIIVSNGKDKPLFWDGAAGTFDDYVANPVSYVTYRAQANFFNRLVQANITTGSHDRQLIGWSVIDSFIDFTNPGAGEIEASGIRGSYQRALILGDRLFIYTEESISGMTYIGGDVIFSLEQVVQETRLVSARTIVNLGPFHIFLSQENCFAFDGSRLVRTLGDAIYRQYRNELDSTRLAEAFAYHDVPKQQVHFLIPVNSGGHAVYLLDYDTFNISNSKWTRQSYATQPTCMGQWSRISTLTWNSYFLLHTPWNQWHSKWNQGSVRAGFPVRVVGCGVKVLVADDSVSTDSGTAVSAYYDTVDYTVQDEALSANARFLEIEFEAQGTRADVYYSIDTGRNYTLADTVILSSQWIKYRIPIDVVSNQLRVRLSNSEATGALALRPLIRVWYKAVGPKND